MRLPSRTTVRNAAPFLAATLLIAATLVTAWINAPSTGDEDYAAPQATDRFAGRNLAGRLAATGITVTRYATAEAAFGSLAGGRTTLFVPAPEYLDPAYFARLADLPATLRIVLVEPGAGALGEVASRFGVPFTETADRWPTEVVPPGDCGVPEAAAAGPAALGKHRYDTGADAAVCYGGSLVVAATNGQEYVLAGAADPFLDERIGEHGNAALAVGLLSRYPRVAWLDLHSQAAGAVPATPEPHRSPEYVPPPWTGSPTPMPSCTTPVREGDGCWSVPSTYSYSPRARPSRAPDQAAPDDPTNPLWGAFPPWLWAALLGLLLAGFLLVLARARRLGPPVAEKLPVLVRSGETMTGRGRLYERAKARGHALAVLRRAAIDRLLPALDLDPKAHPEQVAAAVAERSGAELSYVHQILYGPEPTDDAALTHAADALDLLVQHTLSDRPQETP